MMVDEKKGVVKAYWQDVRDRVAAVEPEFAKIVDKLGVDKTFPVYLTYYPYGAITGDTESPFMPLAEGGFYRLSDPNAPTDIIKHLGYGKDGLPLGMLLEKEIEYFINIKEKRVSLPYAIYAPGTFFPLSRVLSKMDGRVYSPNGVLLMTSGLRSVLMLPTIGCFANHMNLQRDFNIKAPPPNSLYHHWQVFKELVNSEIINSSWRSCILYFSEKWVTKLHADKAWLPLKLYLHEQAWKKSEFHRNNFYYDVIFSMMQQRRNLKPNPYLADTARHLFTIALGAAPGYAPACDNESLPLEELQKIFFESYGLKKYYPTIMKPTHFIFEKDTLPIYYSLQHPTTQMFSPPSCKLNSVLFAMRELEHIMSVYLNELGKDAAVGSDTILSEIAKNVTVNFYHNQFDPHRIVKLSEKIAEVDPRFNGDYHLYKTPESGFSSDSPFFRGCISIVRNPKQTS